MMECPPVGSVLDHLMFHKAIIDEGDRSRKIDHYLELLKEAEGGIPKVSSDPLDRSIQLVFELVVGNNLDPWDVDLVQFTKLYTEKMQDEEVNFIVAGKLMFMAWTILRLQSEKVLWNHEQAEAGELFCSDWDFDHLDMFCDSLVPSHRFDLPEEIELTEAVRHSESRAVSLVELLDAFDEARKEAEARMKRSALRDAMRNAGIVFDEKSHPEDLEQDVEAVWERIQRCGAGAIRIEDIYNGRKEDRVMVFVSLLFLAKMGKIALMQDDFPYGQILLEVRVPWDIGTLEDAAQVKVPVVNGEMVM